MWKNVRNRARGIGLVLLPALVVALLVQTQKAAGGGITPLPICVKVPNGSFENGFDLWSLKRCVGGYGKFSTFTDADIVDMTSTGCDAHVACLSTFVTARWTCDKPTGSAAQAQVSLCTTAKVTRRFLKFKVTGGWGAIIVDQGLAKYNALVRITNQAGRVIKCPIAEGRFQSDFLECPTGLAIDGIIPTTTICCDLMPPTGTDPGIQIGDEVRIEVIWSTAVIACDDCDYAEFGGRLCVDNFQFCGACIMPQPGGVLRPVNSETITVDDDWTSDRDPATVLDEVSDRILQQIPLLEEEALNESEDSVVEELTTER